MAKKTTAPAENEVDQVVDQVIETSTEAAPQASTFELNAPKPEPVQVGHGSRDFGREPKNYEAPVEEPSTPAQDGGQEEAQV